MFASAARRVRSRNLKPSLWTITPEIYFLRKRGESLRSTYNSFPAGIVVSYPIVYIYITYLSFHLLNLIHIDPTLIVLFTKIHMYGNS